ncbi:hypothetical protein FEM48_Zijuj05G0071900 [Ziziphus jujuba var. spinosa]|uniref:Apyrase 7 n=1 Tax=Ziziphus jujuba var. spinosa TaxID=714518 RepID=A0A978VDJ7_ZIZJJ|nr:probable apyrase 7 [Ziziphus jujuba var. spinosa]XP_015882613.2 probable apyrase 7 [Ziziphus jujuba var. spinosa]KAH7528436.1 hypothetical protein FEM48_Zijuj05G0071900 [Ziziphus jujuba var. spinosa]
MEPKSPSKLKLPVMGLFQYKRVLKLTVIVSVMVVILVGAYLAFKPGTSTSVLKGSYYTVVVDCGSSGTRINVYEWVANSSSKRELPILLHSYPDNSTHNSLWKSSCKYHCMQTEPGLDKSIGNSSGVRASLEPLIMWAENMVPFERRSSTPIFVLATAGLRRLAIEEAMGILEDVEAVVKDYSFMHRKSWIRVLSGKEEAYYGWVALNYKMGSLSNHSRSPNLGLLDLGGSSLQVVMEINDVKEETHLVRSKFGFTEHQILAYSLPAYGLNEAFDRTVAMLSHTQELRESTGGRLKLRHPCFGSDFVQNYTCYGCFRRNVANQKILTSELLRSEYPSVYLVGEPNWEHCKLLARAAAVNSSSLDLPWTTAGEESKARFCADNDSGIINWTALAHPAARFHALSGFFVVYDMLNLHPRANLTKIWENGQQLCSGSWANFSSVSGNQHNAGQNCFRVPYMASLIEDALCLGDREILFGPADVSWTLGAALVEGEFPWIATTISNGTLIVNMDVISSPIVIFVLLLCLVVIVYRSQVKLPMSGKKVAAPGAPGTSLPTYIHPKRRPN